MKILCVFSSLKPNSQVYTVKYQMAKAFVAQHSSKYSNIVLSFYHQTVGKAAMKTM